MCGFMRDALDLTHPELEAFMAGLGEKRFRADQVFQWLHARGARSWDEMTDLGRTLRARLAAEDGGRRIGNLVYMGMGEPLHNYAQVTRSLRILGHDLGANLSFRRITVSTAGLVPGIEKLGREDVRPNLAVSLNATTDAV